MKRLRDGEILNHELVLRKMFDEVLVIVSRQGGATSKAKPHESKQNECKRPSFHAAANDGNDGGNEGENVVAMKADDE
jgi:hypothetical protein